MNDNYERLIMDVLGIILAGGKGERLYPLTEERSKPGVPIGGKYRLIDFVLSNVANSGIESIYVLTQVKAQSLMRYLEEAWRVSDFRNDRFLTVVPAQMRVGSDWYQGTADAVYQDIKLIERHRPELVVNFGADHIHRVNIQQMIERHRAVGADVSVAVLPVDIEMATGFGIVEVNADWLKKNPAPRIEIEGHSDERGTNEYNLALGAKRAQAAKDYLTSLGIPADRIATTSYGEEIPVCRSQGEDCWQKNRRDRFVTLALRPGA
jgi:NDP-sugar pyrophosphorylase family protein